MTLNVAVCPTETVLFEGWVVMVGATADAVTVRTAESVFPSSEAEIVEVPVSVPVASPVLLTVALAVEVQVTLEDISPVELSEYVPVAVNCRVSPLTMPGEVGVTLIEASVTAGVAFGLSAVAPPPQPERLSVLKNNIQNAARKLGFFMFFLL